MKRLTKKIDNGRFVTTDAEARSYGETDPEDGFFYNYFTGEAVDKLAAYEDTGLEPADIEELLAAVPKWISVEERLPEQYKPVLVSYVGYNTNSLLSDMVAYRDGDGDWCWWDVEFPSGEICKVKITHWMPLPEPPQKGVE